MLLANNDGETDLDTPFIENVSNVPIQYTVCHPADLCLLKGWVDIYSASHLVQTTNHASASLLKLPPWLMEVR